METIAICITTRNRNEVVEWSLKHWKKYCPENAKIFVVDDASFIPFERASFRFENNVGIARSKNKCLEIAEKFDHIFLADDDIYPIKENWHERYIQSELNHICLSFETRLDGKRYSPNVFIDGQYNGMNSFNAPNGCFLYLKKKVLETVGGLRNDFGLWGYEHYEYSQRIFNAGLMPKPFLDFPDSLDYFHVMDYYNQITSSVSRVVKVPLIAKNRALFEKYMDSSDFVEYIENNP